MATATWPERLRELLKFELWSTRDTSITLGGALMLVAILLLTLVLGRVARSFVVGVVRRRANQADEGTAYALARIAQYIVTAFGILFGLENAGISISTFAALGAVFAVGVGIGVQSIAQNFISGLILLVERPIKKGDNVTVGNVTGVVDSIAIRATRILTGDDVAVIVPNSKLVTEVVENASEPTRRRRHRITLRVSYDADPNRVEELLLELAARHPQVNSEPAPVVLLDALGDVGLDFQLQVWIADPAQAGKVCSDLRRAILAALKANDIRVALALAPATGPRT